MPPRGRKAKAAAPLKFDKRLVLNQWVLSLFEVSSIDELYGIMRDASEGYDENNISRFYYRITERLFERVELNNDLLLAYDENIFSHTQAITGKREQDISWKYFQYLSLLFTEIYLDRYFTDSDALLEALNSHVEEFNDGKPARDQVDPFQSDDLKKLAFWNATGSGKTLLMHINILQYQHYLEKHGRQGELNRVILLTPNEGLSKQHLDEFKLSGLKAELFDKDGGSLFTGKQIEIIDIHKLKDEMGEKTVAIDAFEGNNLVLVDEGHRGASGKDWMEKRNKLSEEGFSFEYSATFGQAVSGNQVLSKEYAKCILFDYSYKYFHGDDYGKHYSILNLADDSDEAIRRRYLTACLLAFYQQQILFNDKKQEFVSYLLEKPLWVFVGGSVNAVRTVRGQKVSDVLDILLFLQTFTKDKAGSVADLKRLLDGSAGLVDERGQDIFHKTFQYLQSKGVTAAEAFSSIMATLFNCPVDGAELHLENLKGVGGEIGLKMGDNDCFGVINVGDDSALLKLCEENGFSVVQKDFATSLFRELNNKDSAVNILIGSKKFMEGWSCWRVSTMGLMNVGKSEGSEIIQLFGRGVRLKGKDFSLKRSSRPETEQHSPKFIRMLETLNVFGVQANYMQTFRQYLEEEGLPTGAEDIEEFFLPVLKNVTAKPLKVIRVKKGMSFKKQAPRPVLSGASAGDVRVVLDWHPKIQAMKSSDKKAPLTAIQKNHHRLSESNIAFMDLDALWFELQKFKNERSWYNLTLTREAIPNLLADDSWYKLLIPEEELQFTGSDDFKRILRWQEIAATLLKKYCEAFFSAQQTKWESAHSEYTELSEEDYGLVREADGTQGYLFNIDKDEHLDVLEKLKQLKEAVKGGKLKDLEAKQSVLTSFNFVRHLYGPLIHIAGTSGVQVAPVHLNDGEKDFVCDLREFYHSHEAFFEGKELYLLRNQSKGKGLGVHTDKSPFYPDFILWLVVAGKQYVTFVDPKGIRNINGLKDHKIQFHKTVKNVEAQLADKDVVLNSFIVSTTPYADGGWWDDTWTLADFEANNVFFQKDDPSYVGKILDKIVA
jgi:hypothetical protein